MTETTTPGTTAGLPSAESLPAPIAALREAGVAIWLDDLSRELIRGGELGRLVHSLGVVGVTTNPTIFASALSKGEAYDDQLRELAAQGVTPERAIFAITTDDVREACDVLAPVYEATGGQDGRVSIEVDPGAARDTERTVDLAKRLWSTVDRPNLYIKIPATVEGLPAISAVLAEGISVNVTLIFSLERYQAVLDAYQSGLEAAQAAGRDLGSIASVASFFVSRVDAAVDKKLDALGTDRAAAVRGGTAIANARLAHRLFTEVSSQERWQALLAAGANPQRPLWASTGVKDKAYPDTRYVDELVTSGVVNTMPRATLEAVADHGDLRGDTVTGAYDAAEQQAAALEPLGIDLAEVTVALEDEGLEKFDASWAELVETVTEGLQRAAQGKDGLAGEADEAP